MAATDPPTIPKPETPQLAEAERATLLERLARRIVSPDGFDRETLANIEQLPDNE